MSLGMLATSYDFRCHLVYYPICKCLLMAINYINLFGERRIPNISPNPSGKKNKMLRVLMTN